MSSGLWEETRTSRISCWRSYLPHHCKCTPVPHTLYRAYTVANNTFHYDAKSRCVYAPRMLLRNLEAHRTSLPAFTFHARSFRLHFTRFFFFSHTLWIVSYIWSFRFYIDILLLLCLCKNLAIVLHSIKRWIWNLFQRDKSSSMKTCFDVKELLHRSLSSTPLNPRSLHPTSLSL